MSLSILAVDFTFTECYQSSHLVLGKKVNKHISQMSSYCFKLSNTSSLQGPWFRIWFSAAHLRGPYYTEIMMPCRRMVYVCHMKEKLIGYFLSKLGLSLQCQSTVTNHIFLNWAVVTKQTEVLGPRPWIVCQQVAGAAPVGSDSCSPLLTHQGFTASAISCRNKGKALRASEKTDGKSTRRQLKRQLLAD